MEKTIKNDNKDFSILFEHLNKIKREKDYTFMQGTMIAFNELKDPIEKLKQIVLDKEDCFYNIVTTT